MATITTAQKAAILDQDGNPCTPTLHDIGSTQPGIVNVEDQGGAFYAVGVAAGSGQLQAHKLSDGAVSYLSVDVVAAPFEIHLGTPEPK